MTLVFMFPGQSSRYPGMLDKLAGLHPPNAYLLGWASEILGRDLRAQYRADNDAAYARNVDVQVGVFLANHMFLQILQAAGIDAELSCGLSLGEYNHLVHIGALDFPDALRLVQARGEAYDAGPRGSMASVQPIGVEELEEALRGVESSGVLEIVNLNSPSQQVISGDHEAIEEAIRVIEDQTFAQPVVIERAVPMHSSLFTSVAAEFRPHLERAPFHSPRRPYLPNRLGYPLDDPAPEDFVDLLATHVHSPVLWQRSIDHLCERHPDAVLVEVGPKGVLTGLLGRKWHRDHRKGRTDSSEDTTAHLRAVIADLRGLAGVVRQEQPCTTL